MFLGHFGAGLGAKKIDSMPSLGTLFFASQFIDLLWPILLLFGIERVIIEPGNTVFTPINFVYYPFSHGLLSVLLWGVAFGLVYYLIKKKLKTAFLLGVLVLSHWFLDLLVHRPDLPILPGSEIKAGLGIWNSVWLTVTLEVVVFAAGIFFYLKATKAKNKKGNFGLWSFIFFLLIIYTLNMFSAPPDSAQAIGLVGLSQWLLVLWGYWIDKNRTTVTRE